MIGAALLIIAAAAGWHWLSWAVIPVAVMIWAVWRWIDVAYRPDGRCWWCKGTGKRWGSTREKSGPCFFCKGKPPRRRGARKG